MKLLLHHIDVINSEFISGWCFNRMTPFFPVTISFYSGNRKLGLAVCDLPRDDVMEAGLHSTGRCGFSFRFKNSNFPQANHSLKLRTFFGSIELTKINSEAVISPLNLNTVFCFMHIPKTAGTSYNNHIRDWFGYDNWHSHIEVLDEAQQKRLAVPGNYVAGHLPLFEIRKILPLNTPIDLHTIVRNPAHQLHSHLAWIKGIASNDHSEFFGQHPPAVQQLARQLQNQDLSSVNGLAGFIDNMHGFQYDFFDNLQTRYFLYHRPDRVTKDDLNQAIKNTEQFTSIGITEKYQEYFLQCSRRYQRPDQTRPLSRHNPARVDPLFNPDDPAIREVLLPLTTFDQHLYQHLLNG